MHENFERLERYVEIIRVQTLSLRYASYTYQLFRQS